MSDENEELQTWIDPELEARVVALVLGEASAFETADLERILAEKPELGIFKRRIEAVHGLVQAASRQETDPMRMDAARRAKLLEKLGQKENTAAPAAVTAIPQEKTDSTSRPWWKTVAGIAACLLILAFLASISRPAFTNVQSRAAAANKLNEEKLAAMAKAEQDVDEAPSASNAPQSYGMPSARTIILAKPVTAPPQRLAALDNLKALAGDMKDKEDERDDQQSTAMGSSSGIHGSPMSGTRDGVAATQAPVAQTAPLDTAEHDWNPNAAASFSQHIQLGTSSQGLNSGIAATSRQAAARAELQMAGAQNTSGNIAQFQASDAAAPVQEARQELAQAQDSLQEAKSQDDAAAPAGAPQVAAQAGQQMQEAASDAPASGQAQAGQELEDTQKALVGSGQAQQAQAAAATNALADEEKAVPGQMIDALRKAEPAQAKAEAADDVAYSQAEASQAEAAKPMADDRQMASSQNHQEPDAPQAADEASKAEEVQLPQAQAALETADDDQQPAAAPVGAQLAARSDFANRRKVAELSPKREDELEARAAGSKDAAAASGGAAGGGIAMQAQRQKSALYFDEGAIDSNGNTAAAQPQQNEQQLQQAQKQLDEVPAAAPAAPMNAPAAALEELPPTGEAVEDRDSAQQKKRQVAETDYYNVDRTARLSGENTFSGATTLNGGTLAISNGATSSPIRFSAGATTVTAPSAPASLSFGGGVAQVQQQTAAAQSAQADQPAAAAASSEISNTAAGSAGAAPAVMYSGGLVSFAGNATRSPVFKGEIRYGSPIDASKPPVLGDIPVVGRAFANKQAQMAPPDELAESVDKGWNPPIHNHAAQSAETSNQSSVASAGTGGLVITDGLSHAIRAPQTASDGTPTQTFATNGVAQTAQVLNGDASVLGRLSIGRVSDDKKAADSGDLAMNSGKYTVYRGGAVVQVPSALNDELVTKEYKVPMSSFAPIISGPPSLVSQAAKDFLSARGVEFPPGASAEYDNATGSLTVRDSAANIARADAAVLDGKVGQVLNANGQKSGADLLHSPTITTKSGQKAMVPMSPLPQNEVSAADQPYSTFSLHVSDVSFLLAKNALSRGQMPDPEAIRPEEFYNAFDYCDPAPAAGQKIACKIEQAAHPMLQQRNLVRIAMKVSATGRGAGQPLRLTVLLDTSGSMEREDRAASIRRAMQALTSLLGPDDSVTLIGFARQPRLLAESVPGDQAGKLGDIVKRTPAEGGTNMEEAIKTASDLARRHLQAGAQNRVVMLTDGAANLGDADPEQLGKLVEKLRQQGISFDACGVGANGFDDEILEALTRKGGGRYYFLNQPGDADDGFARELAGAFRPAAEDVKMQVRFNPSRVGNYRLIGFEKHRLKQEDFRNDKVTAAQLAAEEAAVALYQAQVLPEGEGEIGEVFVRFRDPATNAIVEQSWTIPYDAGAPALDKASPSMRLATTASLVAEKLRGGAIADAIDLDSLEPVVAQLRGEYPQQSRVHDLVTMFEQTRRMTQRR